MSILLRTVLGVVLCIALPTPILAQPVASPAASRSLPNLTAAQWREDLRFMASEMEHRHANLYHSVSREKFASAVEDLYARIPSLQRNEIIVGMMRIAAMVGDGHSRIDPRKDAKFGFPSLPLKLYLFDDGLYVRAATPEYAALVGARIEAFGGVPVAEAVRRVSEISSRDNEVTPKLFVPLYLDMPDILHALKMSPTHDAATVTFRKGKRIWTADIPAGAVDPLWPSDTDISLMTPEGWVDARTTPQPPMWLQAPLDYHRLIMLPERQALYAQLNMVTDVEGQTLGQFGRKIRQQAEAANPKAVIIDLRLDQGGNHDLRYEFVRELIKTADEDTRLFVLTGRGTFSASEAILVDLDRFTDAVFVGEPAGSKPNSFGDAYRMPMPNSGITVRSSIYWNQLAGQSKDPWTEIDLAVPYSFSDYAAGRDPVLDAALDYTAPRFLEDRLLEAAKSGGADRVRDALMAYQSERANRFQHLGVRFPRAAATLYSQNYPEAALTVARIAANEFPDSVDAMLVLASLAEQEKDRDLALRSGLRTLELDPNNRFARSLVERLQR